VRNNSNKNARVNPFPDMEDPEVRDIFIGVDVGGTFTDLVFFNQSSEKLEVLKVPTSKNIERAIVDGVASSNIDPTRVRLISHATTTATNALLTFSGLAKTALVTNSGFRDVLEIGRQRRAELYNLYSKRPVPLVKREHRFTIKGRILFDGTEREPISKREIELLSKKLAKQDFECVVVGLLNSYSNPSHERMVGELLRRFFKGRIVLSSEVNNEYREYERFSTAVVNATLVPLMSGYLGNLEKSLQTSGYSSTIYLMNSNGDVSTLDYASRFPISIIESGPAAGVLASVELAKSLELSKAATFDMGGTTAKAGIIDNFEPDIAYEFEAAGASHSGRSIKGSGYPVRYPFIDLAEVSAGGGTIAWVDEGGALRMGPQSAGSEPGPAAYGKGGKDPTVTDANIVLGRLHPEHLLGGRMPVHKEQAYKTIAEKISGKLGMKVEETAQSMILKVNHNMSRAISIVSVERGRDPRDYSLIAFGGAGPIHACDLAEEMAIRRIVVPQHPGLFSAYGLLTVDLARMISIPVMSTDLHLSPYFEKLRQEAKATLDKEGVTQFKVFEYVDLRYRGQSYEITLPHSNPEEMRRGFDKKHKEFYGYASLEDEVEAVNAKIRAVVTIPKAKRQSMGRVGLRSDLTPSTDQTRDAWISGKYSSCPVFVREKLVTGHRGTGPAIIEGYDSTIIINSGWTWKINEFEDVDLQRQENVR
jgi:N-methylhydantoinase A